MSIQGISGAGPFSNGLANAFLSGLAGTGRGAFAAPVTALGGQHRATASDPADPLVRFGPIIDSGRGLRVRQGQPSFRGTAYQRSADGDEAFLGSRLGNLTAEERTQVSELRQKDQQVRAHEAAHIAAAGGLARGGAKFEYARGPDGKQYAVGGHVEIDTSPAATPEQTLSKAQQIRRAALAPDSPSGQDRSVAAQAAQMGAQARLEISAQDQPIGTGGGQRSESGTPTGIPTGTSSGHEGNHRGHRHGAVDSEPRVGSDHGRHGRGHGHGGRIHGREGTESVEEEHSGPHRNHGRHRNRRHGTDSVEDRHGGSHGHGGRIGDDDDHHRTGAGDGLPPAAPPSGGGTGVKPVPGVAPRTPPVRDARLGGGALDLVA